jgi:hypothetical protein
MHNRSRMIRVPLSLTPPRSRWFVGNSKGEHPASISRTVTYGMIYPIVSLGKRLVQWLDRLLESGETELGSAGTQPKGPT